MSLEELKHLLNEPIYFLGIKVLPIYVATFFMSFMLVRFILRYATRSLAATAILLLPGVVLHELAHFIVAFITNARPTGLSIIPKKVENQFVLGAVQVQNLTFYNAIPVALAPLLLLVPAVVMPSMIERSDSIFVLSIFLLQGIIGHSALPSMQDWKVAFSKPIGLLMYGALAYLALFPESGLSALRSLLLSSGVI